MALNNKVVRGVVAEIDLPSGATLETGQQREELDQLEGRAHLPPTGHPWGMGQPTGNRLKVEWVVHAPTGGTVNLVARHERAGVVRTQVELK